MEGVQRGPSSGKFSKSLIKAQEFYYSFFENAKALNIRYTIMDCYLTPDVSKIKVNTI